MSPSIKWAYFVFKGHATLQINFHPFRRENYRHRFPNELFYLIMNQRNLEKFRSKSTKKLVLRSPSRQNSILRGVDWSEIFCRTCLNTTFGRFLVFFLVHFHPTLSNHRNIFLIIKVPVFGLILQSKGGSARVLLLIGTIQEIFKNTLFGELRALWKNPRCSWLERILMMLWIIATVPHAMLNNALCSLTSK